MTTAHFDDAVTCSICSTTRSASRSSRPEVGSSEQEQAGFVHDRAAELGHAGRGRSAMTRPVWHGPRRDHTDRTTASTRPRRRLFTAADGRKARRCRRACRHRRRSLSAASTLSSTVSQPNVWTRWKVRRIPRARRVDALARVRRRTRRTRPAGVRRPHPRDDVEERRLPGAVRADQAPDGTFLDREVDTGEGGDPAEADLDALERSTVSTPGPRSART